MKPVDKPEFALKKKALFTLIVRSVAQAQYAGQVGSSETEKESLEEGFHP